MGTVLTAAFPSTAKTGAGPGNKVVMTSGTLDATRTASREPGAANQLADRLRLSMIRLARQLRRQDPSELSIAQLSALATVVASGPLGVGQLAEIEGLPSPAVTRLADKLEEAGLLVRRANPADRRGVHLVATPEGAALLARREQVGNAWLAERLGRLSEADRSALERAVALLESLATERRGDVPAVAEGRRGATEVLA
ncbi:MAG: MarR family transcriptional regulator [Actinomycetota bacterium]|nr:MarR family transcriptional regulator [Actinomycetota bacterium]